jgi:hypothetical protein
MLGALPFWLVVVLSLPLDLLAAGLGVFAGFIASLALRIVRQGVWWDLFIAVVAFWLAFIAALTVPCRGCVYVEDGWTIRNHWPHPLALALAASFLAPFVYHLFMARRAQRSLR